MQQRGFAVSPLLIGAIVLLVLGVLVMFLPIKHESVTVKGIGFAVLGGAALLVALHLRYHL
jgi:drug/metabolite transporter (DMT)-like permease